MNKTLLAFALVAGLVGNVALAHDEAAKDKKAKKTTTTHKHESKDDMGNKHEDMKKTEKVEKTEGQD